LARLHPPAPLSCPSKPLPPIKTSPRQFFDGELWYAVSAAQVPTGDAGGVAKPGAWVGGFDATAAKSRARGRPVRARAVDPPAPHLRGPPLFHGLGRGGRGGEEGGAAAEAAGGGP
jgi:hypothetical protein